MNEININDLPRYSCWIERLLGLALFYSAKRDLCKVDAEYDKNKYAKLLAYYQAHPEATPGEVRDYYEICILGKSAVGQKICISKHGELYLMPNDEVLVLTDRAMIRKMGDISSSKVIVELGCGYGFNLYLLNKIYSLRDTKYIGGDYSQNGVALANQLYRDNDNISVVPFNFYDKTWELLEALEGKAIIFTCNAIEQLPKAEEALLTLSKYREKIERVVHFEPIPALTDDGTLLGLMRWAYARINDYNTDLLSAIRNVGGIITSTEPDIIGINPLNPTSFVEWKYE